MAQHWLTAGSEEDGSTLADWRTAGSEEDGSPSVLCLCLCLCWEWTRTQYLPVAACVEFYTGNLGPAIHLSVFGTRSHEFIFNSRSTPSPPPSPLSPNLCVCLFVAS